MSNQERETPAQAAANRARIAQIEKEAREGSLQRKRDEDAAAAGGIGVYGWGDGTWQRRVAAPTPPPAPPIKTDDQGYAITRLGPEDLSALRRLVRIGRHRDREADALDMAVDVARQILKRYGADEE